MSIDLAPLLEHAFFEVEVQSGSLALDQAHVAFSTGRASPGTSFEVVMPDLPDEAWAVERMIQPLLYFCASSGQEMPACPGVFVALFHGAHLYGIEAARVISWAAELLEASPDALVERFGTHEGGAAERQI
jgi:hypothetical protein